MIFISFYLIPNIVGSGVGFSRDVCGIRLSSSVCIAKGILHLAACGCSGSHKFLRLAIVGQCFCFRYFGYGTIRLIDSQLNLAFCCAIVSVCRGEYHIIFRRLAVRNGGSNCRILPLESAFLTGLTAGQGAVCQCLSIDDCSSGGWGGDGGFCLGNGKVHTGGRIVDSHLCGIITGRLYICSFNLTCSLIILDCIFVRESRRIVTGAK